MMESGDKSAGVPLCVVVTQDVGLFTLWALLACEADTTESGLVPAGLYVVKVLGLYFDAACSTCELSVVNHPLTPRCPLIWVCVLHLDTYMELL